MLVWVLIVHVWGSATWSWPIVISIVRIFIVVAVSLILVGVFAIVRVISVPLLLQISCMSPWSPVTPITSIDIVMRVGHGVLCRTAV